MSAPLPHSAFSPPRRVFDIPRSSFELPLCALGVLWGKTFSLTSCSSRRRYGYGVAGCIVVFQPSSALPVPHSEACRSSWFLFPSRFDHVVCISHASIPASRSLSYGKGVAVTSDQRRISLSSQTRRRDRQPLASLPAEVEGARVLATRKPMVITRSSAWQAWRAAHREASGESRL